MPTLFNRFIDNVARDYANNGFPISQMDGDGGGIVDIAVVNVTSSGLAHLDPTITLQLFPFGTSQVGTDSSGNIGVTKTWTRTPPPKNFYVPSGGSGAEFVDGFFAQDIRGFINLPEASVPDGLSFALQLSCKTAADFTPNAGYAPVTTISATDISWDEDEEKGEVTIQFTRAADPDYFLIEYSFDGVTFFPWAATAGVNREYTDTSYVPDTTIYRVIPVDTTSNIQPTAAAPTVTVVFAGAPDVAITTDLQIDYGFETTPVFSGDPSGLYTLVPSKHTDTLYQRTGAEDTEIVLIPRPFFRTGYAPS